MEEAVNKDVGHKEKVLFEGKVTLNPNSKNTEVADCSVTEGSIIIESTEPLQVPLDRVEDCGALFTPTVVGTKFEVSPNKVTLKYRTASGENKKIEFDMNWEEAGNLIATIDMTKRRMLHARRIGEVLDVDKTWKPRVAGILDIVIGVVALVPSLFSFGFGFYCGITWYGQTGGAQSPLEAAVYVLIPLAAISFSLVGIIGGICALKRKKWGWAVAGSVCAALVVIGIPSLIFVMRSKKEFE